MMTETQGRGAGAGTFCPEPEPLEYFTRSQSRQCWAAPAPNDMQNEAKLANV